MDKQNFYKGVTKQQEPTLEDLDRIFIEKARQQKYDKINKFFAPKKSAASTDSFPRVTYKKNNKKVKKLKFNKGGYVSVQDMEKKFS